MAQSAGIATASAIDPPRYEVSRVSGGSTPFAHSAAAIETADGALRAFWFAGSREGATDASILTSVFSEKDRAWGPEAIAVTPAQLQRDLLRWVRKVGNPVVVRETGGRLRMFVVSVTAGGWAASHIDTLRSDDDGATWTEARRLVASPFFNLSTLVKGGVLYASDGSLVLPAYHELAGKFAELLRIDSDSRVSGKLRLSDSRSAIQPVVVPLPSGDALALMRDVGLPPKRIVETRSHNGGLTWSTPRKLSLPNPDSAVDALRLDDGTLLLAFNDSDADRNDLSLAVSRDEGLSWQRVHRVEHSARPEAEFSYPRLIATRNGDIHLLYTVGKMEIRHLRFNRAWLGMRLRESIR